MPRLVTAVASRASFPARSLAFRRILAGIGAQLLPSSVPNPVAETTGRAGHITTAGAVPCILVSDHCETGREVLTYTAVGIELAARKTSPFDEQRHVRCLAVVLGCGVFGERRRDPQTEARLIIGKPSSQVGHLDAAMIGIGAVDIAGAGFAGVARARGERAGGAAPAASVATGPTARADAAAATRAGPTAVAADPTASGRTPVSASPFSHERLSVVDAPACKSGENNDEDPTYHLSVLFRFRGNFATRLRVFFGKSTESARPQTNSKLRIYRIIPLLLCSQRAIFTAVGRQITSAAPEADLFTQVRRLTEGSEAPVAIPPQRIGHYELVFKLASGGMADVYLARDESEPSTNRVVALKRVHRHLVGRSGYREMFLDEARIAFQIAHPNVCSVLDFGEREGEYYLTMEYLVGEPLARLMNRAARQAEPQGTAPAADRLARTISDACKGLHAAHSAKGPDGSPLEVVHRDVTPRNLFLTFDGRVKVLDFGIATAEMKLHSQEDSELRGNLAYMAPEQLTGGQIDRRVDIWSLGVTFWEMLAMRRLFKRNTPAATAQSVVYDEIAPPSALQPDVPDGLDEVVLRALQRDPDKRWQSAEEMELAIRQVLDAQPMVVGPADLAEWMTRVFPFEEAGKRQLIRMVRR